MIGPNWTAQSLRARFETRAAALQAPRKLTDDSHIQAAVLVPLVAHSNMTTVLFTRRTDHLNHHAGQISFPGGRREEGDASPIETALRETSEEVGLSREHIEILGALPDFHTPSGFSITPVVGLLHPPFELKLDAFEVAEAFEVPLAVLADSRNYQKHRILFETREREVFVVPFRGRFIWGATAGMLAVLTDFLESVD